MNASLPRYLITLTLVLVLLLGGPGTAEAGVPIYTGLAGEPLAFDTSVPVAYLLDRGEFGSRSHARAAELVAQAFQRWQQATGGRLKVQSAGELSQDLTGANVLLFLNDLALPIRPDVTGVVSPVILDSDGSISDLLFGNGGGEFSFGFGVPYAVDARGGQVLASLVILNGRSLAAYSDNYVLGSVTHELGHFLNLGHSQLNAEILFDGDPDNDFLGPQMSYYRGPNNTAPLHLDDRAWIARLYAPADLAQSTGTIRGRVLLPDGVTGLQGANVIARRMGDPQVTAVSGISGYRFRNLTGSGSHDPTVLGTYELPGLPPGTYTVEVTELDRFPTVPTPITRLPGGPKFWRAGSSITDDPLLFTPIVVNAGREVSGIDIVLNGENLGEPKPVVAQRRNALPDAQPVTLPALISGTVEDETSPTAGPPIQSEAELQAVYQVTLVDWTTVTAILSAERRGVDLDLIVLRQSGDERVVEASSTERGTPPELLQLRLPPGRHYFGVRRYGEQGSAYTLRLLATPNPEPKKPPAFTAISYLLVGDVTSTSATARWQTTSDAPTIVYYNQPLKEIGATRRELDHRVSLTDLAPGSETEVRVFAQAGPTLFQLDVMAVPLKMAISPSAGGGPQIVMESSATPFQGRSDWAEVVVKLSNPGDGDALNVRIDQVRLPSGWVDLTEAFYGTPLPDTLIVGRIGAHGAGAFRLRIGRAVGSAEPKVVLHGSYTDVARKALTF